jgi:aspartate aminotransferase/aminotransferase
MPDQQAKSSAAVRAASRRAMGMPRSAIREIMALAAERPNVIHMEVGEPDFTTPAPIIEDAFAAARAGFTKYTSNAGLPSLRRAVAARASRQYGQEIDPGRIVITTGAIGALFSALMAVVDPGDEVLIPDPGWPNYEAIVHLAGATPVRFTMPASRKFLPDVREIEKLITARTKAIVINTPSNPTGAVFSGDMMRDITDLARGSGIYLVSDEIYEDILFEGKHVSAAESGLVDRLFIVSGFSKTYAMTGWRLGWLICPPELAGIAAGIQEPVTSCPSSIAQKAGEAALNGDQRYVSEFRDTFKRRRDIVIDVFGNTGFLPLAPEGAFYALIDIGSTGMDSLAFAKDFLLTHDCAVVPGRTFGPDCDRYVRVAFTIEDEKLREGLKRLRAHIEALAARAEAGQKSR